MIRPFRGGLIFVVFFCLATRAAPGWNLEDCESALRGSSLNNPVYITFKINHKASSNGIEILASLRFRNRVIHSQGPGTLLTALFVSTYPFVDDIHLERENHEGPFKTVLSSETNLRFSTLKTMVLPFNGNREILIRKAGLRKFDRASRELICDLAHCDYPAASNDNFPDVILVDQLIIKNYVPYFFPEISDSQGRHRLRVERRNGILNISIGQKLFAQGENNVLIYHLESSMALEEFLIIDNNEPEWIFRLIVDREHNVGHLYTPDLQLVLSSRE